MRHIGSGLLAIAVLAMAAACTDAPVTASPGPSETAAEGQAPIPASVSTQQDAVFVTLRASTDHILGGETIRLRIEVLNTGLGKIAWQSGGCELLNGFGVEGPRFDQPPKGSDWPDAAGLAKWSATTGGVGFGWVLPPDLPEGVVMGCPSDLRFEDIDPGETISAEAVWTAATTDGVPGPPGAYRITYAFPFVGRMPAEQVPVEIPDLKPIRLALPVEVGGIAFAGIPSTTAIDAALADPRVGEWVNGHMPKERLSGAEILLVDGQWRFTIRVDGDRSTVVLVDPGTGRVTDVQLAD